MPDLTILHYVVCGQIETSLLRNYVIPEIPLNLQPDLPTKYTVQAMQEGKAVNAVETTEQFCMLV